jgi:hypothetical protein
VLPAKSVNRRRKYAEEQRARAQAKRLALYKEIRRSEKDIPKASI